MPLDNKWVLFFGSKNGLRKALSLTISNVLLRWELKNDCIFFRIKKKNSFTSRYIRIIRPSHATKRRNLKDYKESQEGLESFLNS